MPRPKNKVPTVTFTVHLPEDTRARMAVEITGGMSDVVPFGGYKAFVDFALLRTLKSKAACKKFHELQKGKTKWQG